MKQGMLSLPWEELSRTPTMSSRAGIRPWLIPVLGFMSPATAITESLDCNYFTLTIFKLYILIFSISMGKTSEQYNNDSSAFSYQRPWKCKPGRDSSAWTGQAGTASVSVSLNSSIIFCLCIRNLVKVLIDLTYLTSQRVHRRRIMNSGIKFGQHW